MIKFINILSNVITEAKRIKLDPTTYLELSSLADKLWAMRNKTFTKKTQVDGFPFKTSDGVDGFIKIVVNPRLKHIGYMETRPKYSRDPMDFVMELQPKEYGSKKNLFLTIYHEFLHATDPSQSTKMSPKFLTTYSEKSDKQYWGHEIEFRTITNEFLEGLVLEFERRINRLKNLDNKKYLIKSINNILNYFGKGEPLNKLSTDILRRINDENVSDSLVSKVVSDFATDFPETAEFTSKGDEPYYLTYIELVKQHNPEGWKRFLSMLYNTREEILENINKKGT